MNEINSRTLIISASKCAPQHIYSIGPFGARVSFASQQRRALNLVWALKAENVWPRKPRPRAIVIGGGIAGVTAAIALHLQDCAVWIVDAEGSPLTLHRQARHRLVHPSINFWPEEELSWTTRFPFLDWYADNCPTVISTLSGFWQDKFEGKVSNFIAGKTFEKFGRPKGETITLNFTDGSTEDADMVFLTTGFGPERDLEHPKVQSYWTEDHLEDVLNKSPALKWIVSGTGDGGLIDALRVTYPGFMRDELALQILQIEDGPGIRAAVADIERKAQDIPSATSRARFYEAEYTKIARDMSQNAKRKLPDLDAGRIPVELIGRLPAPYDLTSAPIHKIILAYSIYKKRISYRRGTLIKGTPSGHRLQVSRTKVEDVEYDKIIIRHGAKAPIWSFLSTAKVKKLRSDQQRLGDFLIVDTPPGVEPQEQFYTKFPTIPGRSQHPVEFAEQRVDMAREIMRNRFKTGIKIIGSKYQIALDDADLKAAEAVFWDRPKELFGIELLPPSRTSVPMRDLV
ncbi:MAG TPA: hypothetical protein VF503_19875 [Sphingobium sp.]|uniref:hypothetical protein n=1 Tax=Sphingobium sp. TaxID=1912891 RepID=UPI002ED37D0C